MLRYYERCGLVKSLRKDDYAYRVYDNENIGRLQQIVVLRKLQIPLKKIAILLDNPDTATATELFNEHITALGSEITILKAIKTTSETFVVKIEALAATSLDFNLLIDDSVKQLTKTLALTQKNVKEYQAMKKLTIPQLQSKFASQIAILENAALRKTTEIDLQTMTKLGGIDIWHENGKMIMKSDDSDQIGMLTTEQFSNPLKIYARAKTDSSNIRLRYNHIEIIFNWECDYDLIQVDDMTGSEKGWVEREYGNGYDGRIPVDEFVDIEWLIGLEVMVIKVNNEIRYIGSDSDLMKRATSGNDNVRINPAWGSIVTVESLRIIEI